ncbi:MAG: photosynthetic reaction center cytochrome c subunit family protein [Blastocatellia bacterium]
MKLFQCLVLLSFVGFSIASRQSYIREPIAQDSAASSSNQVSSNQEINRSFVKQISEKIAGRENEKAGRVFKNIKLPGYKDVPAKQFLLVMDLGFSQGLGVTCTHCHAEQDFALDDKRPKQAAREMVLMLKTISERLEKMKGLNSKPEDRGINCATCHRGAVIPRQAR